MLTLHSKDHDNLKLFYGRNQYIYIPVRLLRPILRKVLEENNFARFIIDNEEEDKINNLWDIAVGFMNNSLSVQEKIDILLMLNDEIDPNTKIVYDEQYIIVPDSLIEKRLIDEEIPKPTPAPTIKPIPKIPPTLRKRQNPYRVDINYITRRLRTRDLFGARRTRSLGKGKYRVTRHTGLDLVAPVGTRLYPIEDGVVLWVLAAWGRFGLASTSSWKATFTKAAKLNETNPIPNAFLNNVIFFYHSCLYINVTINQE